MRWCKIDGKGIWHYSMYSIDGPGYASTVCGKVGELVPTDEENLEGRRCKECSDFAEKGA